MRILIAAAVLTAVTGCTRVVEVPAQTTQSVQTTESERYEPTTYDLYVDSVHRISEYPIYVSDTDLFSAGLAVCDLLADGATSYDLASLAIDTIGDDEIGLHIFSSIVAAAVTTICPEYEYKIADPGV